MLYLIQILHFALSQQRDKSGKPYRSRQQHNTCFLSGINQLFIVFLYIMYIKYEQTQPRATLDQVMYLKGSIFARSVVSKIMFL